MIEKGTVLRCKTKTLEDKFGLVLWEVVDTGLQSPGNLSAEAANKLYMEAYQKFGEGSKAVEEARKVFEIASGDHDGVKVVMLGGSGPSARKGMTLIDTQTNIKKDIDRGVTTIVPPGKLEEMMKQLAKSGKTANGMPRHGGTGVVEV